MNSAKRISNQTVKKDEKKEQIKAQGIGKSKLVLFGVIAVALVAIIIVVCWEKLHPKLIMTINGDRYYLSDIMPDIYMTESTGAYMDQLYRENYGSSYWDQEAKDGMTNAEYLQDNTLEAFMQKKMIYNEAINAGYTLTDEENSQAESSAQSAFDQLTSGVKNKTGLTKQSFLDYYKESTLANRYKQDIIDGFPIDDAALTANISKEDLRQYNVQFYYIPYTKTDDSGASVDMTDAEKKDAVAELKASVSDIKSLSDFSTYISGATSTDESSKDTADQPKAPEGTNIKYSSASFIETDENVSFSKDLLMEVKSMDKDAISDVLEGEDGCYLFKMVDNNSTEKYDSECQSVITEEENKQFQNYIDNLEVEKYTIDVNYDEWDELQFGTITTE